MRLGRDLGRYLPLCADAAAALSLVFGAVAVGGSMHLLASGVAGVGAARCARDARTLGMGVGAGVGAALFVLSLPIVGPVLLAFVVWPAWTLRQRDTLQQFIEVALPGASDGEPEQAAAPARELSDPAHSAAARLRAVTALRTMNARRAVPLLREAFSHPSEEVRLLAFAILEGREKRVRTGIRDLERGLALLGQESEYDAARRVYHRRLAQHHWELVYAGFLSGESERATLERAARHAVFAMGGDADGACLLLLARIYLRERRAADAWACLQRAERQGVPRSITAPLFAEAAFALRRFDEIPRQLARTEPSDLCRPELLPVAQFWTESRAA